MKNVMLMTLLIVATLILCQEPAFAEKFKAGGNLDPDGEYHANIRMPDMPDLDTGFVIDRTFRLVFGPTIIRWSHRWTSSLLGASGYLGLSVAYSMTDIIVTKTGLMLGYDFDVRSYHLGYCLTITKW